VLKKMHEAHLATQLRNTANKSCRITVIIALSDCKLCKNDMSVLENSTCTVPATNRNETKNGVCILR
jgi:hypothetical protein